jgi:tRNA pseudouridine38-40 synthase
VIFFPILFSFVVAGFFLLMAETDSTNSNNSKREKFIRSEIVNVVDDDGAVDGIQRFKVTVSYDGTDFTGWQIQNTSTNQQGQKDNSIQGRIEQRLSSVFLGKPFGIAIGGSGRTDAGVHAKAQVFHFDAPIVLRIPDKNNKSKKNDDKEETTTTTITTMREIPVTAESVLKFLKGTGLPPSIQVLSVESVPRNFHARESCIKKRYEYMICEGVASPFETRFCFSLGYDKTLSIEKMQEAAKFLIGKRNFSAFGVIEEGDPRDPVKNMQRLDVIRIPSSTSSSSSSSFVKIIAECDRFLWHMMRMISGTLIEVGLLNLTPEDVRDLLHEQERGQKHQTAKVRVRTAPAQGLCLMKVFYEEEE